MSGEFPPAGEQVMDEAHGLIVTWDGNNKYTTWSRHPAGKVVEKTAWWGPMVVSRHEATRLAGQQLAAAIARLPHAPVADPINLIAEEDPDTVTTTETEPRWHSDDDVPCTRRPVDECCGVSGCSCDKTRVTVVPTPGGGGLTVQKMADWGPAAAEAAVEDGWEREAAARGGAVPPGSGDALFLHELHLHELPAGVGQALRTRGAGMLDTMTVAAPEPEPESDDGCEQSEPEPPWGHLPSERQMAAVRDADYGHPGPNFQTIADMWSAWLSARHGVTITLTTDDVGALNVLQKLAREARNQKNDNLDDAVGYADAWRLAAH